jgi:trimeric autotransporter adhesin
MRRFLAFAVLLVFSLPVGLSIAGCGHNPNNYCIKNGHAYGVTTSQPVYATMQPETTGLSLSWGQTGNIGTPTAYNCNGGSATVTHWTYASSNLLMADVSPTGQICAGTWNRNSPGDTSNFTICTPPAGSTVSAFNGCVSTACGTIQITASGGGVTTNPVNIYIHPPITSMTIPSQASCVSQGQSLTNSSGQQISLLAETTVLGPSGVTLCSPSTTSCVSTSANIGTITYAAVNANVVNINNTTNPTDVNPVTGSTTSTSNPNGTATANLPGSTIITASSSDVTSAAGYFSTCPPATISLAVNGSNTATVTASSPQTLVATVTDTNGANVNGLTLNYASTQPQNLGVNATGVVSSAFPSHASVTGICQPPACNQSPINLVGLLGNGMPIAGNVVTIDSPGRVTNQIWMASSQSQYFSEVDLTTGASGAPIPLPYLPNSMVMDAGGDTLYFGSYHELMVFSTTGNQLSKEVTAVPGVVLAVNPGNSEVVINDQLRQVIYLYAPSTGTSTSISGIANHASFSPDGTTAYIVGVNPANGQNTLFVNNSNSGWTSYPLSNEAPYTCQLDAGGTVEVPAYNPNYDPFCGPAATVTVPSVATFLSGDTTAARSYCPNNTTATTLQFYPAAGDTAVSTTQITATTDGFHVLGADTSSFSDIWLQNYNSTQKQEVPGVPVNACPAYNGPPLTLNTSSFNSQALPVTASEIDQVVSSPYANLAFVTYQGSGASGVLPYYVPGTWSTGSFPFGTLSTLQLSSGAQAPVAGIFSPDGSIFFTSTSGDNLVHMVDTSTLTDTQTINPKLTNPSGAGVPAQFLAVKSRATT